MSAKNKLYINKLKRSLVKVLKYIWHFPRNYWHKNLWHKIVSVVVIILVIIIGIMYGIARWYIYSESHIPLQLGVSFDPDYATSLGINPQQTMKALIDIGVKQFRLDSQWSDMEPSPGVYNFSTLDWEMQYAAQAHAKVILVLGLRQPRWPECYAPTWAQSEPQSVWQPQLENFMSKVVERYKNDPALESYQVENEYFLKGFGICTNYSRSRLVSEYDLVKRLDPNHTVIVGRSNNAIGFPVGQPTPDEFSISVYKRVWDAGVTHRYLEYPYPAWYYAFVAGVQKIFFHRDMIIGELQAEAWPPNGQTIPNTSLAEQNKSIDATRLTNRFKFGEATGMRDIVMWGAEYWYYRDVKLHDPSLWNVAKHEYKGSLG
ncbi:MAG: beta-galactosidase [Candidatus Saccharibacteria bacterium]